MTDAAKDSAKRRARETSLAKMNVEVAKLRKAVGQLEKAKRGAPARLVAKVQSPQFRKG